MRNASAAITATILSIALYFALSWGFEALRVLTSATYGLDDVWRSQFVFGIGRWLGLGPGGLIKLAAFFGAIKLTVAGVCAIHVIERIRSLFRGKADSELLEAGLVLIALASIAAVAPALWSQNSDLVREHTVQLLLAGLAAALCIAERGMAAPAVAKAVVQPKDMGWFTPWRR